MMLASLGWTPRELRRVNTAVGLVNYVRFLLDMILSTRLADLWSIL